MPYYEAPEMLRKQLEYWRMYPIWAQERVQIILVDDGSQKYPAAEVLKTASIPQIPISLYRIEEDIPWNHGGARNLAFKEVGEGWVLLTDLDHVLPPESVSTLLSALLQDGNVYTPARYRMKGVLDWEEIHRHSDSFILTREMFWKVGGFDEDFSGYWNGVSHPFRKALRREVEFTDLNNMHLLLFGPDVVKDSSVDLGRKGSEYDIQNTKLRKKFKKALKEYKPTHQLRFTWKRLL